MRQEPAIQLSMFTDEVVKSRKPINTSEYIFPWYWEMSRGWRTNDGKKMIDLYSPWQMKLWAWLKKNVGFEYAPNFKHVHTSGQLKAFYKGEWVAGCGMKSCPQELISHVLHKSYKQTWWNFRHKSRGKVKWKNLDIHTKIWLRENSGYNFGKSFMVGTDSYEHSYFEPSDAHRIFIQDYALYYSVYPSKRMRQIIHHSKKKSA